MKRIYLDNNATTAPHPEVIEIMNNCYQENWGNPSSIHVDGRNAKTILSNSRTQIANLIGAQPSEIIFTSGGTEANNLAIKGIAYSQVTKGKHIITSKIEHPAVLQTCKFLEKKGYSVTYIGTDTNGTVAIPELKNAITSETILITIMMANNEVGSIQPIKEISRIASKHNVIFHTDAVQALGKIPVSVKDLGVNLLSLSGHKIHGPKGIGALYIKKGTKIEALIQGGHQEKNLRPGTENLPALTGLGKACEIAKENLNLTHDIEKLRDLFETELLNKIEHITINGEGANRLPNTSNISFHFTEGESIALSLDLKGISISTGSACASGSLEPSYVLSSMKVPIEFAQGTIRFSLCDKTTSEEINKTVVALIEIVAKMREMSPLYEDMLEKNK